MDLPRRFELGSADTIKIRHDVVHTHKPRPRPSHVMIRVSDAGTAELLGTLSAGWPGQRLIIPSGWLQRVARSAPEGDIGHALGIELAVEWEG